MSTLTELIPVGETTSDKCQDCNNATDPITLEEIGDIPGEFVFRVKDDKVTHCFDIRALHQYYESAGKLQNPLTRTLFSEETLAEFLKRIVELGLSRPKEVSRIREDRLEQERERDRLRELEDIRAALGAEAEEFMGPPDANEHHRAYHHQHRRSTRDRSTNDRLRGGHSQRRRSSEEARRRRALVGRDNMHHVLREMDPLEVASLGAMSGNPIARALLRHSSVLDANPREIVQRASLSRRQIPPSTQEVRPGMRQVTSQPTLHSQGQGPMARSTSQGQKQEDPIFDSARLASRETPNDFGNSMSAIWREQASQRESMLAASRPVNSSHVAHHASGATASGSSGQVGSGTFLQYTPFVSPTFVQPEPSPTTHFSPPATYLEQPFIQPQPPLENPIPANQRPAQTFFQIPQSQFSQTQPRQEIPQRTPVNTITGSDAQLMREMGYQQTKSSTSLWILVGILFALGILMAFILF